MAILYAWESGGAVSTPNGNGVDMPGRCRSIAKKWCAFGLQLKQFAPCCVYFLTRSDRLEINLSVNLSLSVQSQGLSLHTAASGLVLASVSSPNIVYKPCPNLFRHAFVYYMLYLGYVYCIAYIQKHVYTSLDMAYLFYLFSKFIRHAIGLQSVFQKFIILSAGND